MDPVSQGSLGAALAGSAADRARLVAAVGVGALSGMAADLDVLIRSDSDPLLFLEYHRQFSHALLFAPAGALLCAVAGYRPLRRWLTAREVYLYCLLGYASHGLLDACTSYGTQLLWPFSDARIAWNRVSVVDPLFTLPLLGLLLAACLARRRLYARLAVIWALGYLSAGAVQGWRAEAAGSALAAARGHQAERMLVKPSFGNLLVWKLVYRADAFYYVDALRLAGDVTWFPGQRVARLDSARDLPWLDPGSRQAADLARFRRFSSGYLALDRDDPQRVIDVRYSMVPNRIDALWGLQLHPGAPGQHAEFVTDRSSTAADREAMLRLLSGPGQPIPGQ